MRPSLLGRSYNVNSQGEERNWGTKKSILEKGALIQRDRETYAIVPDIKGGLCTPEILRKIADISEKIQSGGGQN